MEYLQEVGVALGKAVKRAMFGRSLLGETIWEEDSGDNRSEKLVPFPLKHFRRVELFLFDYGKEWGVSI